MNECHKHGFKHGLFSGEAVWVGPPDSDGRRGVKLDGFEWYSLPDPIFRKAVAAAREADLAPEVFEAMGEESQSTSLYDGRLPESADIPSLAQFVEICLDKANREKINWRKIDWRKIDSDKNLANWSLEEPDRRDFAHTVEGKWMGKTITRISGACAGYQLANPLAKGLSTAASPPCLSCEGPVSSAGAVRAGPVFPAGMLSREGRPFQFPRPVSSMT